MSLYPSVWRESDCQSHFVVRRGTVFVVPSGLWLGSASEDVDPALVSAIAAALDPAPIHYRDLADRLNADPWDVLDACRSLERSGVITEERGTLNRGRFSRRS
jgi:hypothetical protein